MTSDPPRPVLDVPGKVGYRLEIRDGAPTVEAALSGERWVGLVADASRETARFGRAGNVRTDAGRLDLLPARGS